MCNTPVPPFCPDLCDLLFSPWASERNGFWKFQQIKLFAQFRVGKNKFHHFWTSVENYWKNPLVPPSLEKKHPMPTFRPTRVYFFDAITLSGQPRLPAHDTRLATNNPDVLSVDRDAGAWSGSRLGGTSPVATANLTRSWLMFCQNWTSIWKNTICLLDDRVTSSVQKTLLLDLWLFASTDTAF